MRSWQQIQKSTNFIPSVSRVNNFQTRPFSKQETDNSNDSEKQEHSEPTGLSWSFGNIPVSRTDSSSEDVISEDIQPQLKLSRQTDEEAALAEAERLVIIHETNQSFVPTGKELLEGDSSNDTAGFKQSFESIIQEKPLSISELMSVVPSNAVNTWTPEARIQIGFKFEFEDTDGKQWVVRGHEPELSAVDPNINGSMYWTIRIQCGNEHMMEDPVPINIQQTVFSRWVANVKTTARLQKAHITATPS